MLMDVHGVRRRSRIEVTIEVGSTRTRRTATNMGRTTVLRTDRIARSITTLQTGEEIIVITRQALMRTTVETTLIEDRELEGTPTRLETDIMITTERLAIQTIAEAQKAITMVVAQKTVVTTKLGQ